MEVKSLNQQQKNWGVFVCFSPLTCAKLGWENYVMLHSSEQRLCAGSLSCRRRNRPEGYVSVWHLGMCLHWWIGVPGTQAKVSVPAVLTVQILAHSWALSHAFSKANSGQASRTSSLPEQLPKGSRGETIPIWFPPPYTSLRHYPSSFAPSETLMACFRTSDTCP